TATYTATVTSITGGDWLDVNPKSGNASRDLTVSIKANSLPSSATPYTAQITLAFQNSSTPPITIPVSLTVTPPQIIAVSPQTLSFTVSAGGSTGAQKLTVISNGSAAQFTAAVASTPSGWLSLDVAGGTTPKDLNVTVNSQGLSAGVYNG